MKSFGNSVDAALRAKLAGTVVLIFPLFKCCIQAVSTHKPVKYISWTCKTFHLACQVVYE